MLHRPRGCDVAGLSVDAVLQSAERGTLKKEKDLEDDTVYVLLDSTQDGHSSSGDDTATGQRLVALLEDQVEHLRQQLEIANDANRENHRIIAGLTHRACPRGRGAQNGQEDAWGLG